ncbi:hypothetical protein ABZ819_05370 [Streptomyces venezuelae]|uniref:hypothetical protein n=1 Tax=Streptomyces venezuelae TaxID=54571 RepID=UPI0034470A22
MNDERLHSIDLYDGASIEIVNRHGQDPEPGVVVPNGLRINGANVAVPDGATIRIHDVKEGEPVSITLTVYVRELVIQSWNTGPPKGGTVNPCPPT